MTLSSSADPSSSQPSRARPYNLRRVLASRRALVAIAAVAVTIGLAFNWSWLVAAGVAPVLLSVLPCVAMCALGLCMNGMGQRSIARETSSDVDAETSTAPHAAGSAGARSCCSADVAAADVKPSAASHG